MQPKTPLEVLRATIKSREESIARRERRPPRQPQAHKPREGVFNVLHTDGRYIVYFDCTRFWVSELCPFEVARVKVNGRPTSVGFIDDFLARSFDEADQTAEAALRVKF